MDLGDLVAPLAQDEFLGQVLGRDLRIFPGKPGRFCALFPWSALNDALRYHRLEPSRLRLVRDKRPVPPDAYSTSMRTRNGDAYRKLDIDALIEHLTADTTLVLDSVDELYPDTWELAESIERTVREAVQINAFASWHAREGFGAHWDDHDVLAIQVAGRKRWVIYGPSRRQPLYRDVEPNTAPPTDVIGEFILEDGDVVHIPRGWWHKVEALGEPSLHLSIGICQRTGADLMEWLAGHLRANENFRLDLPRHVGQDTLRRHIDMLRDEVLRTFDDPAALAARFFAAHDAAAERRPRFSFPHMATPAIIPADGGAHVVCVAPRAVLQQHDGVVTLATEGLQWQFAAPARQLLQPLVDGQVMTIDELCELAAGTLDRATVRALVTELAASGLVAVS